MESQISNGMCRCCASQGTFKDVRTAYHWMGEEEVYSDMLRDCLDVTLCTDMEGNINGGICEVCITQLRNAANFKRQVLDTEEQFKLRMSDKLFKQDIVKVELAADNDDSDRDNLSDNFSEYEVPIKMEDSPAEVKPKKRKAAAKASTSRVKKTKTEAGESSKRETMKTTSRYVSKKVTKASMKRSRSSARQLVQAHKNNLLKIFLNSNVNPILGKDQMTGIQCHYCPTTLMQSQDLKEHFVKEHRDEEFLTSKMKQFAKIVWKLDITDMKCELCESPQNSISELLSHFKMEHNLDVATDLDDIYLPFKFDRDDLYCTICQVDYPVFKSLREHMNSHFRNFVCEFCDSGFVSYELLYRHKLRHIQTETTCSQCDKVFASKQLAVRHKQTVHEKQKRYKCNFCEDSFISFNMKMRHLQKAHNKTLRLPCHICNRVFITPSALKFHTTQYHMLERKYVCRNCGIGFSTKANLQSHKAERHNLECKECSMKFSNKEMLKEHMKSHALGCLFCSDMFSNDNALRKHIETVHSNLF